MAKVQNKFEIEHMQINVSRRWVWSRGYACKHIINGHSKTFKEANSGWNRRRVK